MSAARRGCVSFVIPAYEAAATIAETVRSCLRQTWADCEVIVVDDGSRDGTAQAVPAHPKVRVIRKANGGVASARNAGMAAANGEFIAWIDADDIALPERARVQVCALCAHPDAVLVSTDFSAFRDGRPDFEASHIAAYYRAVRTAGGVAALYDEARGLGDAAFAGATLYLGTAYERLVRGNFVHFGTAMVRRETFERAGPMDETLRYGCEYEYILRLARLGRFAYVDAPLLRYRRGPLQLSSHGAGRVPLDTVAILDKLRRDDRPLARREARLFRDRYAQALIEAAEMTLAAHRGRAAVLWLRSLRHRPPLEDVSRVAAKLALPRPMVSMLKRALGRASGAPAH